MFNKTCLRTYSGAAVLMAAFSLTVGCGGKSDSSMGRKRQSATLAQPQSSGGDSDSSSGSGDGVQLEIPQAQEPGNSAPPYSYTVRAVGYRSVQVSLKARTVLKLKFKPGVQDQQIAGTGASAKYSILGVYITVGGQTVPTSPLYNGAFGGEAEWSDTMDFSASLPGTCPASDEDCRETVTITVSKPNYDYWCINYGAGCPWSQVYDTHPWNGTLKIQTDDTGSI